METQALDDIATFLRRLQWIAVVLALLWLAWLLAPVLTPFVLAALLGWLGDPLVDRLQARGRSRSTAVLLVFSAMLLVLLVGLVLLVPMIERQVVTLIDSLPRYREWFVGTVVPWFESRTGLDVGDWLDPARLFELLQRHWEEAGGAATTLLGYLSRSGFMLMLWVVNFVLLPILTYFFLRDWDVFVERMAVLVPRDKVAVVGRLARESDAMLGGFLRGQFLVMLCMGVFYAVTLRLIGLDLGILIGIVAGLLTFIPYVGPATLLVLGGIAALVQYGSWQHLAGVVAVWGLGQLIESYWLTPKLVGDRIGLHPMAVIFAVLAGGQLFGFLGMLLALPVAAVVNVMLRYAHERYTQSRLYAGARPEIVLDAYVDAPEADRENRAGEGGASAAER
jgi:predicted PurR-regulated permease PerM